MTLYHIHVIMTKSDDLLFQNCFTLYFHALEIILLLSVSF